MTALLQANRLLFDAWRIVGAVVLVYLGVSASHSARLLAVRIRPWLSRAAVRRRLERVLGAALIALGVQVAVEAR